LATKHTRSKDNCEITEAARKLDRVVDAVAHKPVFTIEQEDDHFRIVNYYTHNVVIGYVPDSKLARKICDRYNAGKAYSHSRRRELAKLLLEHAKLVSDQAHFNNVYINTKDRDIRTTMDLRLSDVYGRKARVMEQLMSVA
jgi:hypothetical protein